MNKRNNLIEIKSKTALIGIKETNKVVASLMGLTGALFLSLLVNLLLVGNNHQLATKEKIFVEQQDGSTQTAIEQDSDFRSEDVIRETVSNWLYLTWEWDSRIPGTEARDKGVKIKEEGGDRTEYLVPSRVYTASYLIQTGFRQEFLKKMAKLIPDEVYSGSMTSQFTIYHIGVPIRNKNQYAVNVIGTRVDLTQAGEERQARFNKKIVLKTIEPYRNVFGADEPSAFRKHLAHLMKNGLIITSIHNYE
ncbi:MAG: hypothetical protein KME09_00190 [Pleurocapsa minor HA4230-MV1]|jgi:hypothetical protein|nr:hypothetical protein [Pleurocapsa minor HA4230-MV1]